MTNLKCKFTGRSEKYLWWYVINYNRYCNTLKSIPICSTVLIFAILNNNFINVDLIKFILDSGCNVTKRTIIRAIMVLFFEKRIGMGMETRLVILNMLCKGKKKFLHLPIEILATMSKKYDNLVEDAKYLFKEGYTISYRVCPTVIKTMDWEFLDFCLVNNAPIKPSVFRYVKCPIVSINLLRYDTILKSKYLKDNKHANQILNIDRFFTSEYNKTDIDLLINNDVEIKRRPNSNFREFINIPIIINIQKLNMTFESILGDYDEVFRYLHNVNISS